MTERENEQSGPLKQSSVFSFLYMNTASQGKGEKYDPNLYSIISILSNKGMKKRREKNTCIRQQREITYRKCTNMLVTLLPI